MYLLLLCCCCCYAAAAAAAAAAMLLLCCYALLLLLLLLRCKVNHCFDLRVSRPRKGDIAKRMVQVKKVALVPISVSIFLYEKLLLLLSAASYALW